jgi:prefoldin subunit 5
VDGVLPLPGTLSAAQLRSIADSIAAQRRSIEALKAQLSSFDEQLAVLEQILGPLAQWSSKLAELEERLLNVGRGPKTERRASGSDRE